MSTTTWLLLLGTALLLLVLGLWWLKMRQQTPRIAPARSPAAPAVMPAAAARGTGSVTPDTPIAAIAPSPAPESAPPHGTTGQPSDAVYGTERPAVFDGFVWHTAASLGDEARRALLVRLERIPRPPRALHRLTSPDFVAQATSLELAEVVMGEPVVAAKVLARVNAPHYGLQRTVVQIGQAVTYLGLNTVRGICVQYLLDDTFRANSPNLQAVFNRIWDASGVASELCYRLAQKLHHPNPGALATQVVLSYIGHLAAATLLPPEEAQRSASSNLIDRTVAEQARLGVPAGELSRLLMELWTLPPGLTEQVAAVDRTLSGLPAAPEGTTPSPAMQPAKSLFDATTEQALCYVCARLGEQLVQGTITGLTPLPDWAALGPDFHPILPLLSGPWGSTLRQALQSPDLLAALERQLRTVRAA